MNTCRPLTTVQRAVLIGTAALLPMLTPVSGSAQTTRSVVDAENRLRGLLLGPGSSRSQQVPPTVLTTRIVGEWRNENVRMIFYRRDDGISAHAYPKRADGTERHFAAILRLNETKDALVGDWEDLGPDKFQGGSWRVTMSAGRVLVAGPLHGHVSTVHALKPVASEPDPAYADWLGDWSVHGGKLTLSMEHGRLVGLLRMPAHSGLDEPRRELVFAGGRDTFETDNDTLVGLWQGVGEWSSLGGEARMTLLPGKRAFGGTLANDPHYGAWKGSRQSATSQQHGEPRSPGSSGPISPGPIAQGPAPSPNPAPLPGPVAPAPAADGFLPLEKWDVRVDRVENPRDDRLTHVYLTLRNSGTGNLVQTQGVSVRHEDGDGVVTESGQGLRAKPGYPELFGSPPPVVLPGREIKTKFVFDRNGGTARITVVEGKAAADFDF